jgi:hypothetical protein
VRGERRSRDRQTSSPLHPPLHTRPVRPQRPTGWESGGLGASDWYEGVGTPRLPASSRSIRRRARTAHRRAKPFTSVLSQTAGSATPWHRARGLIRPKRTGRSVLRRAFAPPLSGSIPHRSRESEHRSAPFAPSAPGAETWTRGGGLGHDPVRGAHHRRRRAARRRRNRRGSVGNDRGGTRPRHRALGETHARVRAGRPHVRPVAQAQSHRCFGARRHQGSGNRQALGRGAPRREPLLWSPARRRRGAPATRLASQTAQDREPGARGQAPRESVSRSRQIATATLVETTPADMAL